nr:hypothetical protein [Nevskia sp.]
MAGARVVHQRAQRVDRHLARVDLIDHRQHVVEDEACGGVAIDVDGAVRQLHARFFESPLVDRRVHRVAAEAAGGPGHEVIDPLRLGVRNGILEAWPVFIRAADAAIGEHLQHIGAKCRRLRATLLDLTGDRQLLGSLFGRRNAGIDQSSFAHGSVTGRARQKSASGYCGCSGTHLPT